MEVRSGNLHWKPLCCWGRWLWALPDVCTHGCSLGWDGAGGDVGTWPRACLPAGLCIPLLSAPTHVWHHEGGTVWQVVGNMALQNRREAIAVLQSMQAGRDDVSREANQLVLHILNEFWQMYILQRVVLENLLEMRISRSINLCWGILLSIHSSVWLGGTILIYYDVSWINA